MSKRPRQSNRTAAPTQTQSDSEGRAGRKWSPIQWTPVAAVLAIVLVACMVTEGGTEFFPAGGYLEGFYDAQADSLLHGRIDVPPEAIGTEAFIHNGRSHGYFGPTPAIARLPLNLLFPGMAGHWNRVLMLLNTVVFVGMLLLLLRRLEELVPVNQGRRMRDLLGAALVTATAIGSTNFYISASRQVYHESIAWASALSFASAVCVTSYLMRPSRKWLVLSCSTAFFAFFARVSSGVGPIFALFIVDLALLIPVPRLRSFFAPAGLSSPRKTVVAFSVTLAAAVILWGGLNYWKFGRVFTSIPMAIAYGHIPGSLESLFSFANFPSNVWAYFSPSNIRLLTRFPWVDFSGLGVSSLVARFPHTLVKRVEPFASLPAAMPELLMAALAGTVLSLSRLRKELAPIRGPLIGSLVGCGLVFAWGLISYRYLHDLLPWLTFGSAIAIAFIPSIASKRMRYAVASLFMFGVAYSTCVNFWFGILEDRYYVVPRAPEKRIAFLDVGTDIESAGLRGLILNLTHWRGYIPASSLEGVNLVTDLKFPDRPDEPVTRSVSQPPHVGEYAIDLPAAGTYHASIRYASPDSRPLRLFLNGSEVNQVCNVPTGGALARYQIWFTAGVFRLPRGRLHVRLFSASDFPYISMLRFVRVD